MQSIYSGPCNALEQLTSITLSTPGTSHSAAWTASLLPYTTSAVACQASCSCSCSCSCECLEGAACKAMRVVLSKAQGSYDLRRSLHSHRRNRRRKRHKSEYDGKGRNIVYSLHCLNSLTIDRPVPPIDHPAPPIDRPAPPIESLQPIRFIDNIWHVRWIGC